jgi:hypothetical protein
LDQISSSDSSDAGAKAEGVSAQFNKFDTYFNLATLLKVFTALGTVNQEMQASNCRPVNY